VWEIVGTLVSVIGVVVAFSSSLLPVDEDEGSCMVLVWVGAISNGIAKGTLPWCVRGRSTCSGCRVGAEFCVSAAVDNLNQAERGSEDLGGEAPSLC
jgi:hypothetical protein